MNTNLQIIFVSNNGLQYQFSFKKYKITNQKI